MTAYILRNIDPSLWARVKARAAGEGIQLRQLLMHLLRAYADGDISIKAGYNPYSTDWVERKRAADKLRELRAKRSTQEQP
jgi:hypothetical protein